MTGQLNGHNDGLWLDSGLHHLFAIIGDLQVVHQIRDREDFARLDHSEQLIHGHLGEVYQTEQRTQFITIDLVNTRY